MPPTPAGGVGGGENLKSWMTSQTSPFWKKNLHFPRCKISLWNRNIKKNRFLSTPRCFRQGGVCSAVAAQDFKRALGVHGILGETSPQKMEDFHRFPSVKRANDLVKFVVDPFSRWFFGSWLHIKVLRIGVDLPPNGQGFLGQGLSEPTDVGWKHIRRDAKMLVPTISSKAGIPKLLLSVDGAQQLYLSIITTRFLDTIRIALELQFGPADSNQSGETIAIFGQANFQKIPSLSISNPYISASYMSNFQKFWFKQNGSKLGWQTRDPRGTTLISSSRDPF